MRTISKLICTTIILSPLLIIGCQSMGGLFGDSTRYSSQQPYNKYPHANRDSYATSKVMPSTTHRTAKNATYSAVPVEPPSVNNASRTAAKKATSSNSTTTSTSANVTPTNSVVVPAVTPSTGMVAPTAQ
ncbi:MAG: hypothetical protein H0U70_06905 [Tatlockia sp.]|nr:hypothetical protein [Tatlockia sp.]